MKIYRLGFPAFAMMAVTCQANTVISFSPSIVFQNNSRTQTLLLQTSPQNLSNQYVGQNDWRNNLILQAFIGKTVFTNEKVRVDAGVSGGYVSALRFSGVINQFALPAFNNFNYEFQLRSFSLMASSKIFFKKNKKWLPYISASAGAANNRLYSYSETPLIDGAVSMAPFANKTKTSFTYSIGTGVQMITNDSFTVGLGYELSDLGQAQLGPSLSQTTNETPSLKRVYLNKLQVTFNWDR